MMQFAFCNLAVAPVRKEPSDRSEMTTQLLFGDLLEIIEDDLKWAFVKCLFDGYMGWVDKKQIEALTTDEFHRLASLPLFVNQSPWGDSVQIAGQNIKLPAGCSLYGLNNNTLSISGRQYVFNGLSGPYECQGAPKLLESALALLSSPYLWGGKTCLGLDCSGFSQLVFKLNGIMLMRDAAQQAMQGELISFISDSRPGDLVFFDNEESQIVHVGILTDEHTIIHCSGKVRIDAIDHHGIYNKELGKYTHNLRLIRRLFDN